VTRAIGVDAVKMLRLIGDRAPTPRAGPVERRLSFSCLATDCRDTVPADRVPARSGRQLRRRANGGTAYASVEKAVPNLRKDLQISNASGVHAEKDAEYILMATLLL
jgi:hypothetical protein